MPPPRKPHRLKLLTGTARPDRQPKQDPATRLLEAPPPPAHLSKRAAAEWRRVGPAVVAIGTLSGADLRAFELLAQTLATESEARELLDRDGMTTATADGGMKPHPALRTMETARTQARALLADFGLTPKGRQGVDTAPPESGSRASPYAEFVS